jgi:elongation factor G
VKVVIHDGMHHSVDSRGIARTTAGRKAFVAAVRVAGTIAVEPIVTAEISAPDTAMGNIAGDLLFQRG